MDASGSLDRIEIISSGLLEGKQLLVSENASQWMPISELAAIKKFPESFYLISGSSDPNMSSGRTTHMTCSEPSPSDSFNCQPHSHAGRPSDSGQSHTDRRTDRQVVAFESTSFQSEPSHEDFEQLRSSSSSHSLIAARSTRLTKDFERLGEEREKERKKVRRVVTTVAVILTLMCIVLIGVSLALGRKIDEMVTKRTEDYMQQHQLSDAPDSDVSDMKDTTSQPVARRRRQ